MNKCMNCGFEDESAIFCQNCGQQMTPLLSSNNAYAAYPQQNYAQPEQVTYDEIANPNAQNSLMNAPQAMPPQAMTEQERMQFMLRQQQEMINRQQMMMQQMQQAKASQPVVVNVQQSVEQSVEQNVGVTVQGGGEQTDPWFFWLEILAIGGAAWFIAGAWWIGLVTIFILFILLQIPVLGTAICWLLGAGIGLLAGAISHAFDAPTWACWLIGIVIGLGCAVYNTEACEQELAD